MSGDPRRQTLAIYDVSVPLRPGMPTYEGEPGPELRVLKSIARGASANVTSLCLGSHTGTHIDAPHHFLDGRATIEKLPLDSLVGPAQVVEYGGTEHIGALDLEGLMPAGTERLLLKTPNGRFWEDDAFHRDFIGLAGDAARWLVERGIRLVGIDYLSIEQFRSPTHEVHHVLLDAGVVIVEGLDLRAVTPGPYFLVCAPLKVVAAEGAPARVFLLDERP